MCSSIYVEPVCLREAHGSRAPAITSEGALLGHLLWSGHDTLIWDVVPAAYPVLDEEG